MLKHIKLQFLFIASLLIIASCTKNDPEEIHEHEVNKVVLHFTNTADSSTFEVEWELEHDDEEHADEDGDEHAHEGHIELAPNAEYTVEAKFYDVGEHDESSDDVSTIMTTITMGIMRKKEKISRLKLLKKKTCTMCFLKWLVLPM